jgi:hypothetical protein
VFKSPPCYLLAVQPKVSHLTCGSSFFFLENRKDILILMIVYWRLSMLSGYYTGSCIVNICVFPFSVLTIDWAKSRGMSSVSLPVTPKWSLPCAVLQSESGFPPSLHLCHLRSQLFSDLELPACNPAKQVGPMPASSLLCMRNLIVFDRLLMVEKKKKRWIGLKALCLDFISQRDCCIINCRISCSLTWRTEAQPPEMQPCLWAGWLGSDRRWDIPNLFMVKLRTNEHSFEERRGPWP